MDYSWLTAVLAVALVAAAASIISEYRHLALQRYLFKPLPVLLMLVVVISATQVPPLIRALFAGGLVASAVGDLLLIDRRRFVWGLLAFLVAHVCYIFGIWMELSQEPRVLYVLPLTLWGGVLFWILRKELNELEFPVLIYIAVILVMIWLAIEALHQNPSTGAQLLVLGAVSFGLSDSILAIDHFRRPFRVARLLVLVFYYAAQFGIAFSLVLRGPGPIGVG
ncbi:MAG: lysoplasmalogenase [Gammaproteobacteria bacterium]|nr:lysoplasmalogenase [Gammaproteobacteria bacterium]